VGAGLLAKAVFQSLNVLTDPPQSRSSPLPQFFTESGFVPEEGGSRLNGLPGLFLDYVNIPSKPVD
jgi:hypothetical protein